MADEVSRSCLVGWLAVLTCLVPCGRVEEAAFTISSYLAELRILTAGPGGARLAHGVHCRTDGEERSCVVLVPGRSSRSAWSLAWCWPCWLGRRCCRPPVGPPSPRPTASPLPGWSASIPTPPPPPLPGAPPRRPRPMLPGVVRCRDRRCRGRVAATTLTAPTCGSTRSAPTRATPRSWAAARARTRLRWRSTPRTHGSCWSARTTTGGATGHAAPTGAWTAAAVGAASSPP
jgi:hypothetical protein